MNHSCLTPQNALRRPHRGITLLEIMISIGIVGIGLIGVASLIPLAHYKATEGVREERKALFGKRAYREFFVHGFDRPGRYISTGQSTPYWIWRAGQNSFDIYNGLTGQIIPQTYCFDPHWVAARQTLPQPIFSRTFPDEGPSTVLVPRITVLTCRPEVLRESLILHGATPIEASKGATALVAYPTPISLGRADEIFRLHDDIVVQPPDEPFRDDILLKPPGERYRGHPSFNDISQITYLSEQDPSRSLATKSASGGSFSWMATLVPELTSAFNPVNPALMVPYVSNRYKLSIVVFNQRNVLSEFAEEVVAEVSLTNSFITGAAKEITINEVGTFPPILENVGVRNIRQGDWIALIQQFQQLGYTRLQWYQVISADDQTSDTDMTRRLSLSGPDWNPEPNVPIYAVYLRNVETVYEKTVELQQ